MRLIIIIIATLFVTVLADGVLSPFEPIKKVASEIDIKCLADNIYHEARGEGETGMQAVAMVTVNRSKSNAYPNSVCGVVFQPSQFSWTTKEPEINEKAVYLKAKEIARYVLEITQVYDITNGSLYFHTAGILPSWSIKFEKTVEIGNHVFYKPKQK